MYNFTRGGGGGGGGGAKKAAAKWQECLTNLRELTCLMYAVHATVKSYHLQKMPMTKMMSKQLNPYLMIPVLSVTILPVWRLKAFFFVPPANNLYPINGHRHSVG